MFQYYVVEIVKDTQGQYSHNVYWTFDETADKARRKAESKAYELLALAALSETTVHSVTVLSDEGFVVTRQCYKNVTEPDPEPEPELEPENNG